VGKGVNHREEGDTLVFHDPAALQVWNKIDGHQFLMGDKE
jgi:hypothetical protein